MFLQLELNSAVFVLHQELHQYSTIYCVPYCVYTGIGMQYWNDVKKGTIRYHYD